jgi:hypothetical protein
MVVPGFATAVVDKLRADGHHRAATMVADIGADEIDRKVAETLEEEVHGGFFGDFSTMAAEVIKDAVDQEIALMSTSDGDFGGDMCSLALSQPVSES